MATDGAERRAVASTYAPELDGLRAIAVAAVAYSHWLPHWQLGVPFGAGVHLFFALSGFLITRILLGVRDVPSRGAAVWRFYLRRGLRLFPAFFLVLSLAAWADVPLALSQGTIDALQSSDETIRSGKMWDAGLKHAFADGGVYLHYIPMVAKPSWDKLGPALQKTVAEAWESIVDAQRRLAQVAMIARDGNGEIAAVSTALPMLPPRFGQPMYYFRAFIAPAWRTSKLVRDITNRSCEYLEAFARERDFPCIGVLLELENDGFYRALRKPVWHNPRFYYAGRSERGLEVRVFYFAGARLKSAEQVRQIRLPAHP